MLGTAVTSGFWEGDVLAAIKLDGLSTCLLRLESEVNVGPEQLIEDGAYSRAWRGCYSPGVNSMASSGYT